MSQIQPILSLFNLISKPVQKIIELKPKKEKESKQVHVKEKNITDN